jgi:hypothetical protein
VSVFQVERVEKANRHAPFQFQLPDHDTIFEMCHPRDLYYRTLLDFDYLPSSEQVRLLLGEQYDAFDEAAQKVELDGHMIAQIMEAWRSHCGLGSVGETPASST